MNMIKMIHPHLAPKHVPTHRMTDYLMNGWVPAEEQKEPVAEETTYYEADVDASDAVDRDIANAVFEKEIVEHTKEAVSEALMHVDILNAAVAYLGDMQTVDELASGVTAHNNGVGFSAAYARTGRRLWQWVTGKDAKSGEERWDKKCLSHTRADPAFRRQTKNYEFSTATQLARHVCKFHWRQLAHILEPNFTGMCLLKVDTKPRSKFKPSEWIDITGAKVVRVKGGGTQVLWDSRHVWLPTSQIKMAAGALRIPKWLAEKNDMI
tara:strand:- start:1323 stop:2120 length:798 start_codon:yes stop_codon:yes gene_type:complete